MPSLYSTFRTDIAAIQHGYVKQAIRQSLQEVVGNEEIAAIIGPKKAEVTSRVSRLLEQRLSPYGIVVKQFTINELRAPPSVIEAINQKNVMQQQGAHGAERAAEEPVPGAGRLDQGGGPRQGDHRRGGGAGQGQPAPGESITPTLVQYEMSKRWNGQMPQVTGERDADDSAAGGSRAGRRAGRGPPYGLLHV